MVLTEDIEIHIIELKKVIAKYENGKDNELLQWMFFLEDPNNLEVVRIMKENEEIKKAKEKLKTYSLGECHFDIAKAVKLNETEERKNIN